MNRTTLSTSVAAVIILCLAISNARAQPNAIDNELSLVSGHWRVVQMTENGHSIPENQMREWLPGGGILEIVDYTILFKSPVDGAKSTKTFRIDPTSYPKRIVIMERDNTTGSGIYEFDQGKLIVCVTNEQSDLPTDFSAPQGSNRTLLVLSKFEPGTSEIPGMNSKLPERKPLNIPSPPMRQVAQQAPAAQQTLPAPPVPPVPPTNTVSYSQTPAAPVPTPVAANPAAGVVLTDTQVHNMAIGTWRLTDPEGSVDIVFGANGVFQTYRYYQALHNFQVVFVPTPSSSGNWSIINGRLLAKITSSTRASRVNQEFGPAVRSISATDMIFEDGLGRVTRAVKLR